MEERAHGLSWNAHRALSRVNDFILGRTFDQYLNDLLLRSAVERQLRIAGEALARLREIDPATAGQITNLASVVGFRNILAHGYATVSDEVVWTVATIHAPELARKLHALIPDIAEPC